MTESRPVSPTILVITSCTADKADHGCRPMTREEFDDPARRALREVELAPWRRTAGTMYTGEQHRAVLRGVSTLRVVLGPDAVQLAIVSAGYGLLEEADPIVPYNITFDSSMMSTAEVDTRAAHLRIPQAVRERVAAQRLVVFLLGARYLRAIKPPLHASAGQRFVFLAASTEVKRLRSSGTTVVLAGQPETRFGAGFVSLKGKMLDLFARQVRKQGAGLLERVMRDDTSKTFVDAIEAECA